jgi:hypothetical protein
MAASKADSVCSLMQFYYHRISNKFHYKLVIQPLMDTPICLANVKDTTINYTKTTYIQWDIYFSSTPHVPYIQMVYIGEAYQGYIGSLFHHA